MKPTFGDIVRGYLILGAGIALALLGVTYLAGYTTRWMGEYHILADGIAFFFLLGLLPILLVRGILVFFPLKEGTYDLNSPECAVWKMYAPINLICGQHILKAFFPVIFWPVYYQIVGARVGQGTMIGGTITDPIFFEMEEGAVVGQDAIVAGHMITNGKVIFQKVRVGQGATVGAQTLVSPGTRIGRGALIRAASLVLPATQIPDGEVWGGIPARMVKPAATPSTDPQAPSV